MENNISILVIEDNVLIAHTIKLLLEDFGYHVAAVCTTYEKALPAIENVEYDLVISDIDLGHGTQKKSGLILMSYVQEVKKYPFIFLTAFGDRETVKDAASCHPSAYLVKPINEMNLHVAIQLAIENHKNATEKKSEEPVVTDPDFFYVKLGNRLVKLMWRDVDYMESIKNYVKVYSAEYKGGVLIRGSLHLLLISMIPENCRNAFIRISRSMVVAREHILEIGDGFVVTPFGKFESSVDLGKEGFKKL